MQYSNKTIYIHGDGLLFVPEFFVSPDAADGKVGQRLREIFPLQLEVSR